jgi:pimeloyl-ACP methyl ester carboxylesterase
MEYLEPPQYFTRPDGTRLAFRFATAKGPKAKEDALTIIFLPGYRSDMLGGKADAVAQWAANNQLGMLRFDYSGCGESDGAFDAGTLDIWRDDVLMLIDNLIRGPVILIGSSMGGWLALLIALARQSQVKAIIGIAPAPDFTDWGFTSEEKGTLEKYGRLERPSAYDDSVMVTTKAFWQSGKSLCLLNTVIPIDCPVCILQGQQDDAVPWETALRLQSALRSDDVQVTLVKDGDHRLSRDQDIDLLIETVARTINQTTKAS